MNLSRALQALSFRGMARRFERAEPALPLELIAPGDGGLVIPADPEHLKHRPAEDITWKDVAISSALHALLLLLFLGVIDNLLREQQQVSPTPPPISVSIVQEPPPPPPPPPQQQQQQPKPQPQQQPDEDLRLHASDASSEGPGAPKPAAKGEAAPSQPEPGKISLAPSKTESAPAFHDLTPPEPDVRARKTTQAERKKPEPTRAKDDEVAVVEAPPNPSPVRRSETQAAPSTGKAKATGFELVGDENPGGPEAAIYDAYLAAIRDQIFAHREDIRRAYTPGVGFVVGMVVDSAGRLQFNQIVESSGSRAIDWAATTMVNNASLSGFPPPPPQIVKNGRVGMHFFMRFPSDRTKWDEAFASK